MAVSNESMQAKPKLAVIGAGLAGLSAAWLLSKQYSVTLYERHESAGMGVFTADYHSNGLSTRIDIPLRIFTPNYYPSLFALYQYLDIEMESSDHASVFQYLASNQSIKPFFQYHNRTCLGIKVSYLNRNSLTKTGFMLAYQQWRFFKTITKDVKEKKSDFTQMTFTQYLTRHQFSAQFVDHMLMPALAVTLTCDFDSVGNYPADLILEYLTCGIMQQGIVRAKKGVDGIVPKITQGYDVKCAHDVTTIQYNKDHVSLTVKDLSTSQVIEQSFDSVIVACQVDIAAKILSASDSVIQKQQVALLQSIPLEVSTMVLHTDDSLISSNKSVSPVSYLVAENESRAATTVDLTKAFSTYKKQQPVFQTWHPIKLPAADKVICQAQFSRPLVTLNSRTAIRQLQLLNDQSPIKICGSYMANRFPLLDAAVESSVTLARDMGVRIPWEEKGMATHTDIKNEVSVASAVLSS